MPITPVFLSGGSGTRLWPLSRKSYPKQFSAIAGELSLFKATAIRFCGREFGAPIVVTASDFRFIVAEQLQTAGIEPDVILIEPEGRNTAPAVLAAALHAYASNAEALLLVAPCDQVIPDVNAFVTAVSAGVPATEDGQLVTFGITPKRPETGYGYLKLAEAPKGNTPLKLDRFVEKPDIHVATAMLADGEHLYLWNSGIFLFHACDIIAAFETHAPRLMRPVKTALEAATRDLKFLRLEPDAWAQADDISIDYAVVEKADNLSAVPLSTSWSDLGDWNSVWREASSDENGVVAEGKVTAIDCNDTLLRSESDNLEVVGIGLKDVITVAMPDAVLVADKSRAQDVKEAVRVLKRKGVKQATIFPKDYRPWGWFESLIIGSRFQVKRIHVHPGAALSLQSHHHRSEHWIVVEGTAKVTIDDEVKLITENQSVYIPLGAVHRMENPGKVPMVLIEVQTGSYLNEDDIIRYEDVYSRA